MSKPIGVVDGSNGHPNISRPIPSPMEAKAAAQATSLLPPAPQQALRGTLPNTPLAVSVIAALLGGLLFTSLGLAARPILQSLGAEGWNWARKRLGIYGAAMGLFHLAEFWTTAGWNYPKLSVDSFLLNNGAQYHYAHAFGLAEYFISSYFFPNKFASFISSAVYLSAVVSILVAAQAFRSLAMIHANTSFSHVVKAVKLDDHTLITHGVYAWSRHPSYVGFFYWAVATQMLLGNIVSTLAFIVILGRFFAHRIRGEEQYLVKFFGKDYIEYRKRVGTGLPFIISSA